MCRERNQCVTDCKGPACSLYHDATVKRRFQSLSSTSRPGRASGAPHDPPTILDESSPRRCQYLLQPQSRNNEQPFDVVSPSPHVLTTPPGRSWPVRNQRSDRFCIVYALPCRHPKPSSGQALLLGFPLRRQCHADCHNEEQSSVLTSLLVSRISPLLVLFFSLVRLAILFGMSEWTMCVYHKTVSQVAGLRSES